VAGIHGEIPSEGSITEGYRTLRGDARTRRSDVAATRGDRGGARFRATARSSARWMRRSNPAGRRNRGRAAGAATESDTIASVKPSTTPVFQRARVAAVARGAAA